MPVNLPALVTRFLTPNVVGSIASALGLNPAVAQTAVNAAVPSLLAAFGKVAGQPGGAQQLADAAAQQTGTLDNFARMLGTGTQSPLAEQGSKMLSSLLGGRDQNALTGAISKFAGIGQGSTGSLLGMVAPVVMGTIAQQQGATRTLDPNKITSLLASQKDNIAAAMPSGLSNLLGGTGLLDALGGATRTATAAGSEASAASAAAVRSVADTGRGIAAPASTKWLYWLIPAAAIAALLVYVVVRPTEPAVQGNTTGVQSAVLGDIDVGKQVIDSIGGLRSTLTGIKDSASAEAALPKLQEAVAQIDNVSELAGRLPAEQRKLVSGLVSPTMPTLNQLLDKVLALPDLPENVKPVLDALRTKLTVLAT